MECQGNNHDWFLANVDQSKPTAPYVRATWLCACSAIKIVDHQDLSHPDRRIKVMQQRERTQEAIASLEATP